MAFRATAREDSSKVPSLPTRFHSYSYRNGDVSQKIQAATMSTVACSDAVKITCMGS